MDAIRKAAQIGAPLLVVAQKAPDKWGGPPALLASYFRTQFQASNGAVVQNLDASWKQIKIAAESAFPRTSSRPSLNAAES